MAEVSEELERLIRVMPETLANKIAAGEVVQRPASAAKELVENAIDAGASEVTLILKDAGSTLIQVIDDGCGMSRTDAAACFQRHATSKITSIEDLERIQTLGFRGEALASIASVAQVELRTKRVTDEAGVRVRIEGGEVKDVAPCATQNGTTLAVRNLFYNVPARRNFLKTPATEFKHLIETFQFLALSNPRVGFTLLHDDNEVYRLAAAPSGTTFFDALRFRIRELFGPGHADSLVPIEETTSYLSVRGLVSNPDFHRRSRGEQFLFVNGRYIKDRSLEHAVVQGYGNLLPDGAHPFFTLFLEMDPRHVDVNVHPTKAEVKFDDDRGVYGFLRAVVKKGIGSAFLMPQMDDEGDSRTSGGIFQAGPPREAGFGAPREAGFGTPASGGTVGSFRMEGPPSRAESPSSDARSMPEAEPFPTREAPGTLTDRLYGPLPSGAEHPGPAESDDDTPGDTLLWQLHDRYILTQIRSGLMIVDQNAAHERVLYERALQTMQGGFGLSQQLLFPHTLDFNPADFELLKELVPDLEALGFDLEVFSGRSVVIRGVPADIRAGDERSVLDDILEQYKTYRDRYQLKGRDNLAKSMARRSAIRAGTRLSAKEMRSLIDQLFQCEMPYACPHGRPTIIKIPIEELDKRFGNK